MNEKEIAVVTEPRRGRPKGSLNKRTLFARDWAERLQCDPVEFLIKCIKTDTIETTQSDASGKAVLDAEGRPLTYLAVIPFDTRVQSAYQYMYPSLQSTQFHGEVNVPVQVEVPTAEIIKRPELASALSDLAILMAEHDASADGHQRFEPVPGFLLDKYD